MKEIVTELKVLISDYLWILLHTVYSRVPKSKQKIIIFYTYSLLCKAYLLRTFDEALREANPLTPTHAPYVIYQS